MFYDHDSSTSVERKPRAFLPPDFGHFIRLPLRYIVSEGSEFGSSQFYRDHITRHERMGKEPNEKPRAAR